MQTLPANHAVVIGGSVGGMMAARVLTSHFQRVTLVDRDELPISGEPRRGVPQGQHAHAILSAGLEVFENAYPGFRDELLAAGGVPADASADGRWYQENGHMRRVVSGIRGVMIGRPQLEALMRKRLFSIANLSILENHDALGLTTGHQKTHVTGVRLKAPGDSETTLPADLVVDARGRASHGKPWISELGFAPPEIRKVEVAIGYSTRVFRRLPSHLEGDRFVVTPPTPQGKRGGVMLCLDGQRWIVTLVGYFGQYAPLDLAGYRDFARSLPCQDIDSVVKDAEAIGEGIGTRFPASVRHSYEHLTRFPEGFLVFGDAICSFNPIYGQGMSVSALESQVLDGVLREGTREIAKRFFRGAAKVIDAPWSIAAGNDLRIPEAVGPRTPQTKFINWYMSKLLAGSHRSEALSLAFHRVGNLLAPPESLLSPRVALRVLAASLLP